MSRRQKEPLREFSEEEHQWLRRIARSTSEPSGHVVRAQQLLAVAAGASYITAARVTGRKSGDAVAQLVARFNREGLKARRAEKRKRRAAHLPGSRTRTNSAGSAPRTGSGNGWNGKLVFNNFARCSAPGGGRTPEGQHPYHSNGSQRSGIRLAANALLVPNRCFNQAAQRRSAGQGN